MTRNSLRRLALASGASLAAFAANAQAVDPVSAAAALTSLGTGTSAYGPIMWGVAVVAVGIMIGVKWIKRGRGAA